MLWLFREPVLRLLPASFMDEDVFAAVLCIRLVVYSVAAIEMYYLNAGYQCSGRYAQGTFLFDLAYPLEAAALVAACLLDGRMIVAALAMTSVRVVALLAYYLRLLHYEPWMKLGWSHASLAVVRRLAHPALASLSMTVSSALSLEGLVLTLGIVVSPTATAIFATTRTVTRVPLSFARPGEPRHLPEMTCRLFPPATSVPGSEPGGAQPRLHHRHRRPCRDRVHRRRPVRGRRALASTS